MDGPAMSRICYGLKLLLENPTMHGIKGHPGRTVVRGPDLHCSLETKTREPSRETLGGSIAIGLGSWPDGPGPPRCPCTMQTAVALCLLNYHRGNGFHTEIWPKHSS